MKWFKRKPRVRRVFSRQVACYEEAIALVDIMERHGIEVVSVCPYHRECKVPKRNGKLQVKVGTFWAVFGRYDIKDNPDVSGAAVEYEQMITAGARQIVLPAGRPKVTKDAGNAPATP